MGKEDETERQSDPDIVKWILDALLKVKRDKQYPNADRIIETIKSSHSATSELIEAQLDLAVNQGVIEKRMDNGSCTYRLAVKSSPRKQTNNHDSSSNDFESDCLTVKKDTDLLPIVYAAIVGLNGKNGSTLKGIERFITKNYSIKCAEGVELGSQIRNTAKKAVVSGKLLHASRYYRVPETETTEGKNKDELKLDHATHENEAASPKTVENDCGHTAESTDPSAIGPVRLDSTTTGAEAADNITAGDAKNTCTTTAKDAAGDVGDSDRNNKDSEAPESGAKVDATNDKANARVSVTGDAERPVSGDWTYAVIVCESDKKVRSLGVFYCPGVGAYCFI